MRPVLAIVKSIYDCFRYDIRTCLAKLKIIDRKSYGKILKYKNLYRGKKCFLIGSGPSLTIEDLTKIHNNKEFVSIACNSLFKAYELTDWRADLYCIADNGVFNSVGERVICAQEGNPIFVCDSIYKTLKKQEQKNVIPIKIKLNRDYPQRRRFSGNAEKYVYRFGSVLYFMIQLAVYLGFDEIYLLGCDCNYSYTKNADGTIEKTGDKDYFLPGYEERKGHQPINQFEIVMPDYDEARRYCDSNGIKIYNATRGGKLESFVRVDADELLK